MSQVFSPSNPLWIWPDQAVKNANLISSFLKTIWWLPINILIKYSLPNLAMRAFTTGLLLSFPAYCPCTFRPSYLLTLSLEWPSHLPLPGWLISGSCLHSTSPRSLRSPSMSSVKNNAKLLLAYHSLYLTVTACLLVYISTYFLAPHPPHYIIVSARIETVVGSTITSRALTQKLENSRCATNMLT